MYNLVGNHCLSIWLLHTSVIAKVTIIVILHSRQCENRQISVALIHSRLYCVQPVAWLQRAVPVHSLGCAHPDLKSRTATCPAVCDL